MNGTAAGHVVCCLQFLPSGVQAAQSEHGAGQTAAHESQFGPVLQSYIGELSNIATLLAGTNVQGQVWEIHSLIEPRLVAGALHPIHNVLGGLARAEHDQV